MNQSSEKLFLAQQQPETRKLSAEQQPERKSPFFMKKVKRRKGLERTTKASFEVSSAAYLNMLKKKLHIFFAEEKILVMKASEGWYT